MPTTTTITRDTLIRAAVPRTHALDEVRQCLLRCHHVRRGSQRDKHHRPMPVPGNPAGLWSIAQMIVARSSRGDALFHAAMLACVLGGGLIAGSAGDWMWQSSNRGVSNAAVHKHCSMLSVAPSAQKQICLSVASHNRTYRLCP
jgi:hypothetical protein